MILIDRSCSALGGSLVRLRSVVLRRASMPFSVLFVPSISNVCIFQWVSSYFFSFCNYVCLLVCLMVFYATFNNISAISWRSVLLVEETGGPAKKTTDISQVTDKLYHIMLYTSPWSRFELTTSVVIGTDYTGSCKSNCHTITTTAAPIL